MEEGPIIAASTAIAMGEEEEAVLGQLALTLFADTMTHIQPLGVKAEIALPMTSQESCVDMLQEVAGGSIMQTILDWVAGAI